MPQTYLIFQTLLLLFWLHSCMIWTKLTRTDVVFSRAASAVLLCAGFWIFRYAGEIPKNQIKKSAFLKVPVGQRRATGQPGGTQAPVWRGSPLAAPWRPLGGSHTPWCPTLALFIPSARKLQNRSRFSDLRR